MRGTDETTPQNIPLRKPDKACAVGLAVLTREQRGELTTPTAAEKAARIEEEIKLKPRQKPRGGHGSGSGGEIDRGKTARKDDHAVPFAGEKTAAS